MSSDRFAACLAHVLASEGGYVDHPSDPGGATNMGITRATLARWRRISPVTVLPKSAVRELRREEAAAIYRAYYWDRCRAEALPAGVDLAVFDYAVNSGPDRAVRTLQQLVGVGADGIVGPKTLAAVSLRAPAALIEALCRARLGFLERLATFATFGRGWTRRVASVRSAALDAAQIPQPTRELSMTWLDGYKTYIVAALMLALGAAQLAGLEVPGIGAGTGMELIMEGFAIMFLRKGVKAALATR